MFKSLWSRSVLDELADIYVSATSPERDRMASGIESLIGRLASDPFDVGESRDDGDRLAFTPLLMVRFNVNTAAYRVLIKAVARYGT